ncbi:acyl-CoA carboxylase subunit beta [Streptomyces sp. NPDC002513]
MESAVQPGSAAAVARQHANGRMTARERIDALLDPGSFEELDALVRHRCADPVMAARRPYGDGVVVGTGTINERTVAVFSQDATVFGGALGEAHGAKITKLMELAAKIGCPIVGINDGGGARIQESVDTLALYGGIFFRNVRCSGVVPQISLIMGPCAGGGVYSPALTDFIVMVDKTSNMFITGPDVIKTVTGEQVSLEELGGGNLHNSRSGVAHYLASDEEDAFDYVRGLLDHLPSNNLSEPKSYPPPSPPAGVGPDGLTPTDRELERIIPDSTNQAYDMYEVISRVLDDGEFLEVHALFAPNIIVGFGHVDGRSVGVVANQPLHLAGCLDIDASTKAARFIRICDSFNVPVLSLVDVPGFLPGTDQEWEGIIRHGAKLVYAYAEAMVPKITVIVRKAYGGAYAAMGSKHLGADINLAWPTAEIEVMGAPGAVSVLHRKELAGLDGAELLARRAQLEQKYEATPYADAERGYIDAVIPPSHTRRRVGHALRILADKRVDALPRRHGNIPL